MINDLDKKRRVNQIISSANPEWVGFQDSKMGEKYMGVRTLDFGCGFCIRDNLLLELCCIY